MLNLYFYATMFKRTILVSVFGLIVLGLLVLGGGFAAGWYLASIGGGEGPPLIPVQPTEAARGVDVSAEQGKINWDAVRADSIVFAYARVSEGLRYDSTFVENWGGITGAGLLRGPYHHYDPGADPGAQLTVFIRDIESIFAYTSSDLPPAVLVTSTGGLPSDTFITRLRTFLEGVDDQLHWTPLLFTTQSFYDAELGGLLDAYPLWIGSSGGEPVGLDRPWTFWQYDTQGRVRGISGAAHLNRFRGTPEALWTYIRDLPPRDGS